jgi:S1-C subfamily serine protease
MGARFQGIGSTAGAFGTPSRTKELNQLNRTIRSGKRLSLPLILEWSIAALLLLALCPAASPAAENVEALRRSVVRIYAVSQMPVFDVPWDPGQDASGWGSGFLIADRRILTNAHVVSNARFISVEKEGDARRYEAHVKFIAHDCDLALLEVADPNFYQGTSSLVLGGVPSLDSMVTVLGYPIGGDRLSITRGIVSRIDYRVYSHSGVDSHLVVQIDAAINPGNSGGPVVQEDRVVGVAFQGYSGIVAQNVGYIIPVPVIERFLQDVSDGHYDFYVDLGVQFFPLINPAQRRALGLEPGDYGVMVSEVMRAGAAYGHLQVEDVLLTIDDHPVFSDGRVAMDNDRLLLNEVVERKFKGDTVTLEVLRDGRRIAVTLTLTTPWPYLMQARQYDVRPRFLVFGGLVFQPLSSSFYATLQDQPITLRYFFSQFLEKEIYQQHPEVIVISKILPDPINAYLDRFVLAIVEQVNDTPIRTLHELADAFAEAHEFYVIRVVGDPQPLVLEAGAAKQAAARIRERYGLIEDSYLEGGIVPPDFGIKSQ